MRSVSPSAHVARSARCWRARLAPGLVAAALALPAAAHPYSLDALLGMPLERLLQLQIAPRRTALATQPGASMVWDSRAGRGHHVA